MTLLACDRIPGQGETIMATEAEKLSDRAAAVRSKPGPATG